MSKDNNIIKEVWEKYKHLDELLGDKDWLPADFMGTVLKDLWQAIKTDVKGRVK